MKHRFVKRGKEQSQVDRR